MPITYKNAGWQLELVSSRSMVNSFSPVTMSSNPTLESSSLTFKSSYFNVSLSSLSVAFSLIIQTWSIKSKGGKIICPNSPHSNQIHGPVNFHQNFATKLSQVQVKIQMVRKQTHKSYLNFTAPDLKWDKNLH